MRISSFFVFTLAILLSCIAMTTPSFAKMLNCERYDKNGENQYVAGAFDSWYPKTLQIPTQKFKSVPGRTALVFERATQEINSGHESKMLYTLLTSKKLLMNSPSMPGSARYKCDMKPEEVLAAQKSQTPSPPVKTKSLKGRSDTWLLFSSCSVGNWSGVNQSPYREYILEAKTRGLKCPTQSEFEYVQKIDNRELCLLYADYEKERNGGQRLAWLFKEQLNRGMKCDRSLPAASTTNTSSTSITTSVLTKADNAKAFCKDIGFTAGTEKFGECVLKMMDK